MMIMHLMLTNQTKLPTVILPKNSSDEACPLFLTTPHNILGIPENSIGHLKLFIWAVDAVLRRSVNQAAS